MHLPAISPKVSVSVVFVAAIFMSIMDTTIINVALPAMSRQFKVTGVAILMVLMILMGKDTTLWLMRTLMLLMGVGMAFSFTSVQAASFATITSVETGQASALFNAQRQIGASLGVALLSSVIGLVGITQVSASGVVVPNYTAYHAAFVTAAVIILIAASFGMTVHDSDAAATMRRKVTEMIQKGEIATHATPSGRH